MNVPVPDLGVCSGSDVGSLPSRVAQLLAAEPDLIELDAAADRYLAAQRPATTRRAFSQDWATWERYVEWAGLPLLVGTKGALVGFLLWLEHGAPAVGETGSWPGAAPNTIRRRLTGVLDTLRRHGVQIDPDTMKALAEARRVYRRRLDEAGLRLGRGQAHPVTIRDVLAMSRACPDTTAGRRDRAIVVLGFYGAARASDLSHLRVGDVATEEHGVVLNIRVGKTTGISPLPARRHPLLCPRRAWSEWVAAAELTDGRALRAITRHGTLSDRGLSADAVTEIVSAAGRRAGLAHHVTCHSLRAGFATEAYRGGADPLDIAAQGRWSPHSAELWRYIRRVSQWEHNAAAGLDLEPDREQPRPSR